MSGQEGAAKWQVGQEVLVADPEPLLSFPDCPVCRRRGGWDGVGGWLTCQGCWGVGSTREQMQQAEAEWAAAWRAWRERNPSWPRLDGVRWDYAARCFYPPNAPPPFQGGGCAMVVALRGKAALHQELGAMRRRMLAGEIDRVEVISHASPGRTWTYGDPGQVPEKWADLP